MCEVVYMQGRAKIQGGKENRGFFIYLPDRQARQEGVQKGGFADFNVTYRKDIEPEPPSRRPRHVILLPKKEPETEKVESI